MENKVVVASGNAHKIREIADILSAKVPGEYVAIGSLGEFSEPEENGETFKENALIKALAAYKNTGLPSVGDDSGLVVDALDGAPGVYSARYAGAGHDDAANNAKLLRELADVPLEKRTARFVSVIAYVDVHGNVTYGEGTCEGFIDFVGVGENGFGYDPLFRPVATPNRSMAQLSADEKNEISHRGNALSDLIANLTK